MAVLAVSSTAGIDDPRYRVVRRGGMPIAVNPDQRFVARFSARGVRVRADGVTFGLGLASYGRPGELVAVARAVPRSAANGVSYRFGALTEKFTNGPAGLEQTFTLRTRPAARAAGFLVLSLRSSAHVSVSGGAAVIGRAHGVVLSYRDLSVRDATGRTLPARLESHRGDLRIMVDDHAARYPLRIDPLIQEGSDLAPSNPSGSVTTFGDAIALSADGNTALIADYTDGNYRGAVWVFTRSGATWTQGQKLTPSDEAGGGTFGTTVALSADGDTALIGGVFDGNGTGAAWVFTRSGTTWTQQGAKLLPSDGTQGDDFGGSVALSADGNTAIVGAPGEHGLAGAASVFTRAGSTWAQQGPMLTGTGASTHAEFGSAVALSADGNTAMIGGANDGGGGGGAAWAFTRLGSTWAQQGPKLSPSDEQAPEVGSFGTSVALSIDGNTALIGAGGGTGAAWVFTRTQSTWTQQGSALTADDETTGGDFGESVALSADGNTALIGAENDENGAGAAWIFTRQGSTWTQQGSKTTSDSDASAILFGSGVALSADATTAIIGAAEIGTAEVLTTGAAIFAPSNLNFAPQPTGTPGPELWVALENAGGAPLTFTGTAQITGANAADFTTPAGDDSCHDATLYHEQTCRIGIQFTPTAAGPRTASLTFGPSNATSANPTAISLNGSGVATPTADTTVPPATTTVPSPKQRAIGKVTCVLTKHRRRISLRCALRRPPPTRETPRIMITRDSKVIATGKGRLHGRTITASLGLRSKPRNGTSATVTISIPGTTSTATTKARVR